MAAATESAEDIISSLESVLTLLLVSGISEGLLLRLLQVDENVSPEPETWSGERAPTVVDVAILTSYVERGNEKATIIEIPSMFPKLRKHLKLQLVLVSLFKSETQSLKSDEVPKFKDCVERLILN
jgi:hypothetical protein